MRAFGIALALSGGLFEPASATTIVVTTTADDYAEGANGNCSLREAVIAANSDAPVDACPAGAGADTIELSAGTFMIGPAPRDLSTDGPSIGDLDIRGDVTLVGAGAGVTVLDGQRKTRLLDVHAGNHTVVVRDLTITNGVYSFPMDQEEGDAIRLSDGSLTLTDVEISHSGGGSCCICNPMWGCSCSGAGGGLLVLGGEAQLTRVYVHHNVAGELGGGVAVRGGELVVEDSRFESNASNLYEGGGAIGVAGGRVTISDSELTGNKSWIGGALAVTFGTAEVIRTWISGNCASGGGGIWVGEGLYSYSPDGRPRPTLRMRDSTLADNCAPFDGDDWVVPQFASGGGIAVESGATVEIQSSELMGNTADVSGGGIAAVDFSWYIGRQRGEPTSVRLWDSRVSGGAAPIGGGIGVVQGEFAPTWEWIAYPLEIAIERSTIDGNSASDWGGGVFVGNGSRTSLVSSTVANNVTPTGVAAGLAVFGADVAVQETTLLGAGDVAGSALKVIDEPLCGSQTCACYYFLDCSSPPRDPATITIEQSLVSGGCDDAAGVIESRGWNLESPGHSCRLDDPLDLVDVADPGLGELTHLGGVAPVLPLLPSSPAVDSGPDTGCSDLDGRGMPRPQDGDGDGVVRCDRGAFELAAACTGSDTDGDGFADGCDNCPSLVNPDQLDSDANGIGDSCDSNGCSSLGRVEARPAAILRAITALAFITLASRRGTGSRGGGSRRRVPAALTRRGSSGAVSRGRR